MRCVIQRVAHASVTIDQTLYASIGKGMLILLGVEDDDEHSDIQWLCKKIVNLRIFSDGASKMNLSIEDVAGEIMIISQFTLYASTKKGNRPSFIKAGKPGFAEQMYRQFIQEIAKLCNTEIKKGLFGADMKIDLRNDGPVTIIIDSRTRE
ncbi:MAG: D-tyrosyl-tRNA(Tyr) deacylase [Saprospiraceae bacterium]|nr:D-tyrosyl-tRNA(Tyr) deacylase [Saprospiraceae bacterium]